MHLIKVYLSIFVLQKIGWNLFIPLFLWIPLEQTNSHLHIEWWFFAPDECRGLMFLLPPAAHVLFHFCSCDCQVFYPVSFYWCSIHLQKSGSLNLYIVKQLTAPNPNLAWTKKTKMQTKKENTKISFCTESRNKKRNWSKKNSPLSIFNLSYAFVKLTVFTIPF